MSQFLKSVNPRLRETVKTSVARCPSSDLFRFRNPIRTHQPGKRSVARFFKIPSEAVTIITSSTWISQPRRILKNGFFVAYLCYVKNQKKDNLNMIFKLSNNARIYVEFSAKFCIKLRRHKFFETALLGLACRKLRSYQRLNSPG